MNCPKCNNPISPNAKFCDACGTPIAQASEQPAPVVPEQPAPVVPEQPAPVVSEQPAPVVPEPQPEVQPQVPAPEYAPPQSAQNFDAQYQQYQQTPQYPQYSQYPQYPQYQQAPYGVAVKKKSKAPFIVIPIVSVLVIAGIVLGIIFGVKGCSGSGDIHRLTDSNGVFIVEDESINTADSEAQAKIEKHLKDNNVDSIMAYMNMYISEYGEYVYEVKGNALLLEVKLKIDADQSQLESLKNSIESQMSNVDVKSDRELYGVSNLVEVQAIVEKNGNVYNQKVYK